MLKIPTHSQMNKTCELPNKGNNVFVEYINLIAKDFLFLRRRGMITINKNHKRQIKSISQ